MERLSCRGGARLALATAGVLVGLFSGMLAPGAARAHFNSGLYSHERSDCASRVDPIGVVFYGNVEWQWARTHVWHHAGWGETLIEGEQYFASHGVCYIQNTAVADGQVWESRNHMRMRQTTDSDPSLGITTVGTPHWDQRVTCNDGSEGHAVPPTGYYDARETLIDYMWMDHDYYYAYWGNTQPMPQCNDWDATGDGVVVYIFTE